MSTRSITAAESVFADAIASVWKNRYTATLNVVDLTGGIPADKQVIESWVKSKVTADSDDLIRDRVAQAIVDRGLTAEQAAVEVAHEISANGFRRTKPGGPLFIGGYQIKAALKEAVNIAVAGGHLASRGWGKTNRGSTAFTAEHVMVPDHEVIISRDGVPLTEPDEIVLRFAHTRNGSGIVREEVCYGVDLTFQVWTDTDDYEKHWPAIWTLGQQQGIGASRSLSRGRYVVTQWERQK